MRFNFNLTIGKASKARITTINFPNMTNQVDIDSLIKSFRYAYFHSFDCEGKIRIVQNEDVDLDMRITLAQAYKMGSEKGIQRMLDDLEQTIRIISLEIFQLNNLDLEILEIPI